MPGISWIAQEKKRQMVADYACLKNYTAVARKNAVAPNTVKKYVLLAKKDGRSPDADSGSGEAACIENGGGGENSRITGGSVLEKTGRKTEDGAEECGAGEKINRVLDMLLGRMSDPEAVMELSAYQAAKVYAMLCDRVGGSADQPACAAVPTYSDDVYFDANSFSSAGTAAISTYACCASFDCTLRT